MRGAFCNSSARLVLLLLAALPAAAQLSETVEVRVLELEVVVLDRSGRAVEGLTRDDFQVKGSEIVNFFSVRRGTIVENTDTKLPPEAQSIATTVIVFLDDTRMTPRGKFRAVAALKEYLGANVGPATTAMLVRWSGFLDVRTRPSERPGPLLAELDALGKTPPQLERSERRDLMRWLDESISGVYPRAGLARFQELWRFYIGYADRESREVERTIDALREITRLAASFEGRKVLLYIAEGLPMHAGRELFDYWERASRAIAFDAQAFTQEFARQVYDPLDVARYDRSLVFQRLTREAQAANVAFFALDPAGLAVETNFDVASSIATLSSSLGRMNDEAGMRGVTSDTGGRYIANENDLGRALDVLSEQFTTYYSLGIRPPHHGFSTVSVTVKNRPDLRVLTARQRRPATREEEMERAVRSRLYSLRADNPLEADVAVGAISEIGGKCVAPVRFTFPREIVAIHFALLDEKLQESDVRVTTQPAISLGLRKGSKYVLSVAIADRATGEISYLQREIDCR